MYKDVSVNENEVTMTKTYLPSLQSEQGLISYIKEVSQYKLLSAEEEYMLAKRVSEDQDTEAAHTLITSHLRLVVKIAMGMRNYGLSMMDMIAEGNIGLMHSIKKFDPELGHRLSTYAMWWIKASIQEFVMKSWSLVKIGTTAAQKKLFFSLNKAKNKIRDIHRGKQYNEIEEIAQELSVSTQDVRDMEQRMSKDVSLNAPVNSADEGSISLLDTIRDSNTSHEEMLSEKSELSSRRAIFLSAMETLNEREKDIVSARNLKDSAETLENLSQKFGVSRERVRQIEARAMEKVTEYCRDTLN